LAGLTTASDECTASILVAALADGANARSHFSIPTPAEAVIGAIARLGLFVAGGVVLMKRLKGNHGSDCRTEYETEGKSVEVQCSDFGDNQSEDWDLQDFDGVIESTFDHDGPTQSLCNTSDHFSSGSYCHELL
jgi:hypothetical protein